MATISMFRGGTPDFKPQFCRGDWPEFTPPFSGPQYEDTPPFNSHGCGAFNQGYLNLYFPLNPNMCQNDSHKWMREAMRNLSAVGDILQLFWMPLRSYATFQYFEVSRGDALVDGVYLKPVAQRCSWDIAKREWKYTIDADYAAAVTASGVGQFPCGAIKPTDQQYGLIDLRPAVGKKPCTFGHNMVKVDDKGVPTDGLDEHYGGIILGLQIAEGSATAIADLWCSNMCIYCALKFQSFECSTQVG